MKQLHYDRPNNLSKLHDELLAALTDCRPVNGEAVMIVEGLGDDVWLTVPDDVDETQIAAVVAAHDPTPRPALSSEADRKWHCKPKWSN